MIFGEGPIIKNITGDLNKLFLQGTRAGQPIINVEGDAAADQATVQLMADRDPVIRDISTGLGYGIRNVTVSGSAPLHLVNALDRAIEITSSIEPVQDLHGQDSPWPAGVGVNKLLFSNSDMSATKNGITASYNATTGLITVTGTETYGSAFAVLISENAFKLPNFVAGETYTISRTQVTGELSGSIYIQISYRRTSGTTQSLVLNNRASTTFTVPSDFDYAYNVFVGVYAGASDLNNEFKIQLESGSTATAWSPYENLCPISGWNAVKVKRTGKNLFDPNYSNYIVSSRSYLYNTDCYPSAALKMTLIDKDPSVDISGCYIGFQNGLSESSTFPAAFNWVIQNGSITSNTTNIIPSGVLTGLFVYPKTAETFNKLLSRYDIMVELGSTATSYAPYQGKTYTIEMPTEAGTVYGGKLTVNKDGSGQVVVDRAEVDLGTLNYSRYSPTATNIPVFYSAVNGIKPSSGGLCKSSAYQCKYWSSLATRTDHTIEVHPTLQYVYIADSQYETAVEFKNAMSGVQLVYPLAILTTYTLTATQVKALKGDNYIWTDCGDELTVIYEQSV